LLGALGALATAGVAVGQAVDPAAELESAAEETGELARDVGSMLFFDAQSTSFNRGLTQQILEGEVVAIGAGVMIAADRIAFDRVKRVVEAKGRIVMMSRDQVFLGEELRYYLDGGDFMIEGATMVANDPKAAAKVAEQILGFTEKELAFEKARQDRGIDIRRRKERLKREAARQALEEGRPLDEDIVGRYGVLLDQEELVNAQENPSLARTNPERKEALKRRRRFYEESRKVAALRTGGRPLPTAYFKIEGETLQRTAGNDFVATESLWTTCRCEEGEAPAWGFRAARTEAQIGGYADLYHPVLEIKGLPVLYLPYLKVPIKDQRQTGFLMPTFGFEQRSGNIYSQPVYFDLGKHRDATLTTDVFENRGTRLGLEYRHQLTQFSGWELRLEGLRDRLWMADRGVREDLVGLYKSGLDNVVDQAVDGTPIPASAGATDRDYYRDQLADPAFWNPLVKDAGHPGLDAVADDPGLSPEERQERAVQRQRLRSEIQPRLERDLDRRLAVPTNTWRGAYAWRGVSFFAPRLSLVSNGEVTSDHRYTEELYVPDDFREAFFGGRDAKAFSAAKAQAHLDGKDFYLGLGTRYGDNFLSEERFEGQQIPAHLKLRSRRFDLLAPDAKLSVTGQVTTDLIRISELKAESKSDVGPLAPAAAAEVPGLGDGSWRRLKFDTLAPLLDDSLVQITHFADGEARYVDHADLEAPRSEIRSWRTGLEFTLPIDGKGELPEALQADEDCGQYKKASEIEECERRVAEAAGKRRFVHHLIDFKLRFSVRPSVVRNGPYADPEPGGLAYFASDRFVVGSETDEDVPEEERMKPHQRITLSTNHAWKLFNRSWSESQSPDQPAAASGSPATKETYEQRRERARRELLRSLDQARRERDIATVTDEERVGPDKAAWLDGRKYELRDEYYENPVNFRAEVAYDFLDEKEREKQRKENRETGSKEALPEPWKDPTAQLQVAHAGFSFSAGVKYSIYARTARELNLGLVFPTFLETNVSLGYNQVKQINLEQNKTTRTRERSLSIATGLIPPVTTYVSLKSRVQDDKAPTHTNGVFAAYGFEYKSPSDCWGLQFAREKEYDEDETSASYVMRLSIVFMGQQRPLPNMSQGVTRQIREEESG
jgi:hypothetical protein